MNPLQHWWPVARSEELESRPLARTLLGTPLVLFRDANRSARALLDRCPHRHAPLSEGRIQKGEVVCGYHGWRFTADGECAEIPGLTCPSKSDMRFVASYSTREIHDLIWIRLNESVHEITSPSNTDCETDRFIMTAKVRSTIELAAENFLDATHTHFVHPGLVRRAGNRRRITAVVRRISDGIEAEYRDEGKQSGLISRWLESDRVSSWGRFRLPGVAEIEYRGRRGLTLMITAYLTPQDDQHLLIHALVATRCGVLPAWIKRAVLSRLFARVLAQDSEVLARQAENISRHAPAPFLDSSLDLLGPSIRRVLRGESLTSEVERSLEMWM